MIVAVMSDSHDHLDKLRRALEIIRKEKAEAIIHCGDFVAPFVLRELEKPGIPVHGVFGNNDGDRYLLTKLSLTELSNITLYDPVGQVDFGGYGIAFTHYQEVAEGIVLSGKYDLVCYGHTHTAVHRKIGDTDFLNPGEIMGKDGAPTFYMVDTVNRSFEKFELNL
ncbi:MAG: metallophosphoesterase [Pseudomonadota bacterium]